MYVVSPFGRLLRHPYKIIKKIIVMESLLIPIFICVVLPVSIVLITSINKMYQEKKRSEIITKAIEANNCCDSEKIVEALRQPRKTERQIANSRLLTGCICTLIGIVLMICGLVCWMLGTPFESDPVEVPMMFGGIMLAIGISYLIVYFITVKQLAGNE